MLSIDAKSIRHQYGTYTALRGIDLSVQGTGITGVLGPNGSGKSTLLGILAGTQTPTRGTISREAPDTRPESLRVGYLPESPPLYPEMTVVDYLTFLGQMRGLSTEEVSTFVSRAMDCFALDFAAHRELGVLSKGLKQRVGLAQALLHRPAYLFLDEPTSGLDPVVADNVRDTIRETAVNCLVLISSHLVNEVEALASRVLVMFEGRIVKDFVFQPGGEGLGNHYRRAIQDALDASPPPE